MSKERRHAPSALGTALRRARDRAGLSQYDLAEKAGVSRQTIANLEAGIARDSKSETLIALAAGLECELKELTDPPGGTPPMAPLLRRFLASHWGQAAQPTEAEVAWLSSLPEISWLGAQPTDESFLELLKALRAAKKEPANDNG